MFVLGDVKEEKCLLCSCAPENPTAAPNNGIPNCCWYTVEGVRVSKEGTQVVSRVCRAGMPLNLEVPRKRPGTGAVCTRYGRSCGMIGATVGDWAKVQGSCRA